MKSPITLASSTAVLVGQLVRLLSSHRSGEVIATAAAIGRTLTAAGSDFHLLGDVVERGLRRRDVRGYRGAGSGHMEPWRRTAEYCAARSRHLSGKEADFVKGMAIWQGEPSEKQISWLFSIKNKLGRRRTRR